MRLKQLMLIFITVETTLSERHFKGVERCMLESIKPSDTKFLYLSDLRLITTIAIEFQLLPEMTQNQLRQCFKGVEQNSCHSKIRTGNYEECGIFVVPKCKPGYVRVDCSICAKQCPQDSLPDSGGILCQKPKLKQRAQFPSIHDCNENKIDCDNFTKFAVEKCPKNYAALGLFFCALKCPPDFVDQGVYCVPPFEVNNNYCMSTFHEHIPPIKVEIS